MYDNRVKARIIMELLDDRKYAVMSSFTEHEMAAINAVSLTDLHDISTQQIDDIVLEFLRDVTASIEEADDGDDNDIPPTLAIPIKPRPDISEKLNAQTPQLLACLVQKLGDEDRQHVMANISEEKKIQMDMVDVDKVPMSDQVIAILVKELALADTK